MTKRKFGFTLAEVLIVIGIIGVVAALTLPNLNHATGDKETITRVKKIYSNLTEAVDRAQAIYGNADTWFKDLSTDAQKSERFANRITEFLKVSKNCEFNAGCWANAALYDSEGDVNFDNYLETLQSNNEYMVTLADGMSLAFFVDSNGSGSVSGRIRVDIDGPNKGKYQEGNDVFTFTIGLIDNNVYTKYLQLIPDSKHDLDYSGYPDFTPYFTKWVIENGNLDYLKCPDQLNWESKTSCE